MEDTEQNVNKSSSTFIQLRDYTSLDDQKNDLSSLTAVEVFNMLRSIEDECNQNTLGTVYRIGEDNIEEHTKGLRLVSYFNGKMMTQQYIGLLKYENTTVFIGSRFDDKNHYFTNYMLEKAMNIRTLIFQDMRPEVARESAFEKLLAFIFIQQIDRAYKKGIYRQYRTYEKNDSKLKGKIDIARHIKENPLFSGNIAYSHREYTIDNDVNLLIFTAYSMLEKKERTLTRNLTNNYRNVKSYINEMKNVFSPASNQEVSRLLHKSTKRIQHSLYKGWEEVRQTAILLLKHMGVLLTPNPPKHKQIYGVLINMNNLWEKYLETLMKREKSFNFTYHEPQKSILFKESDSKGEHGKRTLIPDFISSQIVLDAKYKSSWSNIAKNAYDESWPREDVFQILSYMYVFRCNSGGIICPCQSKEKLQMKYVYPPKEREKNPKFFVIPLNIPIEDDKDIYKYNKFKAEMNENEKSFVTNLKDSLKIIEKNSSSAAN